MSKSVRLVVGIMMGAIIYFAALYGLTSLGVIKRLVASSPMDYGDVTQAAYLVISLVLIGVLSRGNFAGWGFSGTRLKPLIQAVLITIPFELLMIFAIMVTATFMSGPVGPGGSGPVGVMSEFSQTVISVWLVASTCEEILYRGLLYGFLAPLKEHGFRLIRWHISLPVTVCALMFGLGHFCLLGMMPLPIVINIVISCIITGFIAGYFRERSGSLIPAIAAHMTANIVGYTVPGLLSMLVFG